jgi:hypothetical protein
VTYAVRHGWLVPGEGAAGHAPDAGQADRQDFDQERDVEAGSTTS